MGYIFELYILVLEANLQPIHYDAYVSLERMYSIHRGDSYPYGCTRIQQPRPTVDVAEAG